MHLIDRRIGFIFAVFLALLAIGATRAAWLGVVRADDLERAAAVQQEDDITIPAQRGSIKDANGIDLGVSEPAMDIAATPRLVNDATKVAAELAPIIDRDETKILSSLARRDTQFVYLGRGIPATRAERARKLGIPGLEFIPRYRREYPRDWMASQLLGYVGTDGNGLRGLEYTFDKQLAGTDGERRMVKDAMGEPLEIRDTKPVEPGKDVTLTLEADLQDQAEEVLAEVGEKWKPKGATAIVMDPHSGAILALANWPRVNANEPDKAPEEVNVNRAVGTNYEPGSTFKAFTVAAALEEGKVTPDTSFPIGSVLMYADRELRDSEDHGMGSMTVSEIVKYSSNIGAVKIARALGGAKPFDRWIHRFGFGKRTGVDLPGEERGQVLALEDYSGATMGNLPIGQGINVTPMQMMAAYAAIANGGILRAPHIVDKVGTTPTKKPAGKRILRESTAASVRKMLEGVTGEGGTASGAHIEGYTTAGKTGTAEKAINGKYSEEFYVASFVGFAPANNPKLLAAVIVDEPEGDIYGGQVAAPAWKQIVNFALGYKKIRPE
ncbi:penicillin-binding protein 2 [Solirubrobacter sp. CPCC 204708]|uniref:Penicillin-binding protein 2 n=1 Tax=Solirubrobacter deserti TaxID=2282478 RepID=A0ABT4RDU8_9ACTN|nr:penicillin-binding protein 2 [Solirubrobacter deserti]MBE2314689.1 penicillin-binding protein 2 [Solirubrobacter deserti]MDA0136697.1 penicillin-binding protein 2 [Solirubrobacter deserti]